MGRNTIALPFAVCIAAMRLATDPRRAGWAGTGRLTHVKVVVLARCRDRATESRPCETGSSQDRRNSEFGNSVDRAPDGVRGSVINVHDKGLPVENNGAHRCPPSKRADHGTPELRDRAILRGFLAVYQLSRCHGDQHLGIDVATADVWRDIAASTITHRTGRSSAPRG